MSADNALQLLPQRSLDQSILLAVLIGLLTLWALTETLGWSFVGLIVPGYLASVFAIQPSAGVAIAFEAVTTYVLVRLISDVLARTTVWSPFFGRERFFLIVLVSIFVRQNSQIWLLPALLSGIDAALGTRLLFDPKEFTSIGLVLVPLLANMFWKIDLRRGLLHVTLPVAITYAILVGVLLPYTNLSFSSLQLTYDDVALDFLASPKAYIILLSVALLAARVNLRYGWDYSGILVPSLLALAWFEPISVAVTVGEVLLLYAVAKIALAAPGLRARNLEGPRRIVLVFSLGFLLKYALASAVNAWWPEVRVTGLFGFGYVITSLLVVKMLDKRAIGRVIMPAIHMSAVGFVCGSLVGYGLDQIAPREPVQPPSLERAPAPTERLLADAVGVVALATVRARSAPGARADDEPPRKGRAYAALWRAIDAWLVDPSPAHHADAADRARSLGLALRPLWRPVGDHRAYALVEVEEDLSRQQGWDTAVLVPGAPGPIVEVPRPRAEIPAAEAAAVLCERVRCRAIVVSGLDLDPRRDLPGGPRRPPRSIDTAVRHLRSRAVLTLRADPDVAVDRPALHVYRRLPDELAVAALDLPAPPALVWEVTPTRAQARRDRADVVVLRAHPELLWRLLADDARAAHAPAQHPGVALKDWLRATLRDNTTGLPQTVPSLTDLRFLEELVASRLLDARPDRVAWLHRLAALIGYHIAWLPDCVPGAACWVLAERDRPPRHRWGTLAVRADAQAPLALEVPHPIQEVGTWQLAVELWAGSRGAALLVGHDIPVTHGMPRLDPALFANVDNPFHAIHQSIHRALAGRGQARGDPEGPLILQIRGFASWRPIADHLIVGVGAPALHVARQTPPRLAHLLRDDPLLSALRDMATYAGGEPEFITLTGQNNPQLMYSRGVGGVDAALLWFSQPVRELYLDPSPDAIARRVSTAGLTVEHASALSFLLAPAPPPPTATAPAPPGRTARPDPLGRLVAAAERYAVSRDLYQLRRLRQQVARTPGGALRVLWSAALGGPYLALEVVGDAAADRAVVRLAGASADCPRARAGAGSPRAAFAAFLRRCRTITVHTPREDT